MAIKPEKKRLKNFSLQKFYRFRGDKSMTSNNILLLKFINEISFNLLQSDFDKENFFVFWGLEVNREEEEHKQKQ